MLDKKPHFVAETGAASHLFDAFTREGIMKVVERMSSQQDQPLDVGRSRNRGRWRRPKVCLVKEGTPVRFRRGRERPSQQVSNAGPACGKSTKVTIDRRVNVTKSCLSETGWAKTTSRDRNSTQVGNTRDRRTSVWLVSGCR